MAFQELSLSLDLHNHTATINLHRPHESPKPVPAPSVFISNMPFSDEGPLTTEQEKHRVRVHARRLLEELISQLPTE